jgi:hypothetical protein
MATAPVAEERAALHGSEHKERPRLRVGVVAPPWFEIPPPAYGGIESMCDSFRALSSAATMPAR